MSPNDRLYDELLAPVIDDFRATCEVLEGLEPGPGTALARVAQMAKQSAYRAVGDRVADVLGVDRPDWERLRAVVRR